MSHCWSMDVPFFFEVLLALSQPNACESFVIFLDSISFIPGRLYQLSQFWNYLIKSLKSGSRYFAYCEFTWLIISNQDLQ